MCCKEPLTDKPLRAISKCRVASVEDPQITFSWRNKKTIGYARLRKHLSQRALPIVFLFMLSQPSITESFLISSGPANSCDTLQGAKTIIWQSDFRFNLGYIQKTEPVHSISYNIECAPPPPSEVLDRRMRGLICAFAGRSSRGWWWGWGTHYISMGREMPTKGVLYSEFVWNRGLFHCKKSSMINYLSLELGYHKWSCVNDMLRQR